MEGGADGRVVDIDKMTVTLEPDRITKGGLHVPGKDRMEFRPPERKSLLGLDVLAIAKRGSKGDGVFKVPQERNLPSLSALDEDEMSASSGVDDIQTNTSPSRHSYSSQTLSGSFLKFKRDSVFREGSPTSRLPIAYIQPSLWGLHRCKFISERRAYGNVSSWTEGDLTALKLNES